MKRLLSIYQYLAPAILTPASFVLWYREYHGRLDLVATAWLVPIVWAYVVPGIGTNILNVWEFDTRLRLGRFRPHHGFVFGSATSMIAWLVHGPWWAIALVLFVVNFVYDVIALRAGILHVYNQPWAEGRSEVAIALDYAPWFFGGFGIIYGFGLGRNAGVVLIAALLVPALGYVCYSKARYGHWGVSAQCRTTSQVVPSSRIVAGKDKLRACPTQSIPELLNWLILLAAAIATSGCLWLASHAPLWAAVLASIAFAFINNIPFALMHEAVHGVASSNQQRNSLFGFFASCMFPTSFSLQRVAHAGHHARNRTDNDLYDYYLPSESRLVRNVWLYAGNLLGLYWFMIPISNVLYLFATPFYRSRLFMERVAPKLGFGPHVHDIATLAPLRVWIEIACAFGYQLALWILLGLEWKGWLLAHWLFALHWSALQYVDHAWSARDVTNGAWNLRVPRLVRWLTLNYQLHHAHHAHPSAAWTELPRLVDTSLPQPSFWQIYISLWRHGVQPAPPMGAGAQFELFERGAS